MADHNKPTVASNYTNLIAELDARLDDLALGCDPASTTVVNPVLNTTRWTSSLKKWQKWNGTAWADLTDVYAISISGSAGSLATGVFDTATPLMAGTAAAGTSTKVSRGDHRHPTDTSRLAKADNLSDVENVATTRSNLGLRAIGDAATDTPSNDRLGSAAYASIEQIPLNVWPSEKTSSYTVTLDDLGKTLLVSGTTTITLPLAADVFNPGKPFSVSIKALTGATVTVARSGTDTIETVAANKSMAANTGLLFFPASITSWETI